MNQGSVKKVLIHIQPTCILVERVFFANSGVNSGVAISDSGLYIDAMLCLDGVLTLICYLALDCPTAQLAACEILTEPSMPRSVSRPETNSIPTSLLITLCNMPIHFHKEERLKALLYPTLISLVYKSPRNLKTLRSEMHPAMLAYYLSQLHEQHSALASMRLTEVSRTTTTFLSSPSSSSTVVGVPLGEIDLMRGAGSILKSHYSPKTLVDTSRKIPTDLWVEIIEMVS